MEQDLLKAEVVNIEIEKCRESALLPQYAKTGDAGMDIAAAKDILIEPGQTKLIPTGLKVAIPEGYEIQIRPRSGLSLNTPLRITNSPGTIDSGYRDEICIIMSNECCTCRLSDKLKDARPYSVETKGNMPGSYYIKAGDRIAQIILGRIPRILWQQTESVNGVGNNRGGGFGSTGVKGEM